MGLRKIAIRLAASVALLFELCRNRARGAQSTRDQQDSNSAGLSTRIQIRSIDRQTHQISVVRFTEPRKIGT